MMAFFTASYQQLLWSPNSIGVPEGPFDRVWFYLPQLVYLRFQLYCNWTQLSWLPSWLSYIIVQCPHDLWNRMFNCHAVHRSLSSGASLCSSTVGTFTLSHIISLNPPTRSLSITGHWNVSLPSGASPWKGIFGRVKGQNTTFRATSHILT